MAQLRLFASAREAAGTSREVIDASTVEEVLSIAVQKFGPGFATVLESCKVWVNGETAPPEFPVNAHDEIAVLPPVSGGCR